MEKQTIENILRRKRMGSFNSLVLEYKNYIKQKKINLNQRTILNCNGTKLALTLKQIQVLQLIAKGFSNSKIASKLGIKETTIKLLVYRLMRCLENILQENVDRFYLVIIAQQLISSEHELCVKNYNSINLNHRK